MIREELLPAINITETSNDPEETFEKQMNFTLNVTLSEIKPRVFTNSDRTCEVVLRKIACSLIVVSVTLTIKMLVTASHGRGLPLSQCLVMHIRLGIRTEIINANIELPSQTMQDIFGETPLISRACSPPRYFGEITPEQARSVYVY